MYQILWQCFFTLTTPYVRKTFYNPKRIWKHEVTFEWFSPNFGVRYPKGQYIKTICWLWTWWSTTGQNVRPCKFASFYCEVKHKDTIIKVCLFVYYYRKKDFILENINYFRVFFSFTDNCGSFLMNCYHNCIP